jgi:hypothetical protein
VPEHERPFERGVPDPARYDPVAVGAAEPHRGDVDEQLALARARLGLLGQAEVARAVKAKRSYRAPGLAR